LEERFTVLRNEELMSGLIRFGQGNVHDFIVRSNDVNNALTYLWVELGFDIARVSSFKAVNFVTFENNEVLRYTLYQAKNQGHQSISQNITHAKNNQEEG
jgi:uncharacterized protein YrrD